ncbi:MAG: NAD(P)H-dependent oxidoreductase [Gammaproteobacteria bacterium]|nr:NAD(P)H-dependent oxidoreductase [Gammaproteobacteria bacterium]
MLGWSDVDKLNTAVIYGSVRSERRGIRVARFVVNKLEERGHDVTLIDPLEYPLPMLDKMYNEYAEGKAPEAMEQVASILRQAHGFVIVSAEYNHAVPPALKNLLDHYTRLYNYKPSAIVSYSKGPFGGVRAMINLRSILAELGTPSIPSALPVSKIEDAFEEDGTVIEEMYDKRIVKFLDEYEWYACALRAARACQACDDDMPSQQQLCRE